MRTTVRLHPDLLRAAKAHAAENGRTLTDLLEEALRETLSRRSAACSVQPIRLKTFKGNGLRAGVDLDDSAALADLMDS